MPNPVVHFEVLARNATKAQKFYKKLFGWNINAKNPMKYGLVRKGGKRGIGGGIGTPYGNRKTFVTFYVEVKNINEMLKKVRRLGGKVVIPRTVIPKMVTFAQFRDSAGHVVGLIESR